MESFFMAETAKYLYMLFHGQPGIFDFHIVSTEGHLFPVLPSEAFSTPAVCPQPSSAPRRSWANQSLSQVKQCLAAGQERSAGAAAKQRQAWSAQAEASVVLSGALRQAEQGSRRSCHDLCSGWGLPHWRKKVRRGHHAVSWA